MMVITRWYQSPGLAGNCRVDARRGPEGKPAEGEGLVRSYNLTEKCFCTPI